MSASYPSSIKTFTTKTNKVDLVDAAHMNDVQLEVTAIETELGLLVKGSAADLKTRLGISLANNGGIVYSPSFIPAAVKGQPVFRTDSDTLYLWNGTTWVPAVAGPSSVFSATHSTTQNASTGETVLSLDTEDFDTGSNQSGGTFTAPTSGKYLFTADIYIDPPVGTGLVYIALRVNGTVSRYLGGTYCADTNNTSLGGSCIINLSANDTVTLSFNSTHASTIVVKAESRFTGCRLAN